MSHHALIVKQLPLIEHAALVQALVRRTVGMLHRLDGSLHGYEIGRNALAPAGRDLGTRLRTLEPLRCQAASALNDYHDVQIENPVADAGRRTVSTPSSISGDI